MLEVEVLGHQGVQPQDIQQVIEVIPLRPVFFVELLSLHRGLCRLAVDLNQLSQRVVAVLGVLFVVVHLELDDNVLLKQEVLEVLEGNTLGEGFPAGQSVLVLSVSDGVLQLLVVFPGLSQHFPRHLRLPFAVLPAPGLVEHRQQKNDLVPLVQQEESVVLDVLQYLVVLA